MAQIPSGGGAGSPPIAASTSEDFEVQISSSGSDPSQPGEVIITSQLEADAWGPFATIPGAVSAIPPDINHEVILRLPTGTWVLDADQFGSYSRFSRGLNGSLILAGDDSWVQTPGTPAAMAVTSSDGNGNVTLTTDPGLTPDAYKGQYLLVLTGKDAGQFKPIRSHSGTSIVVAGSYSGGGLDGTSVVQIVTRATTVEVNAGVFGQTVIRSGKISNTVTLEIWGINIVPNSGDTWWWFDIDDAVIHFSGGTRLVAGGVSGGQASVYFSDCVIDAVNYVTSAVVVQGGLVRTFWGSSRPMLIIGDGVTAGRYAISIGGVGGDSNIVNAAVYIFGEQCFDGWTAAILMANFANSNIRISTGMRTDQAAAYAVELTRGARMYCSDLTALAASTFKGSISDVNLDGNDLTWSEINGLPDKNAVSPPLSSVMEE